MNAESIEVIIGLSVMAFLAYLSISILKKTDKKEQVNYKNISQMAQNLATCKVSTRQTVLSELCENPDWTDAEVAELKGVLEGMLNTRITINKSGERKGLTARTRNDR